MEQTHPSLRLPSQVWHFAFPLQQISPSAEVVLEIFAVNVPRAESSDGGFRIAQSTGMSVAGGLKGDVLEVRHASLFEALIRNVAPDERSAFSFAKSDNFIYREEMLRPMDGYRRTNNGRAEILDGCSKPNRIDTRIRGRDQVSSPYHRAVQFCGLGRP